jgi:hypothetical protein
MQYCLLVRIYKTIILPVVLCGCETWSLTLREEHTQCVQVLLGLCSLKIQDVNYFQNFTLIIQNSLL